MSDQWIFTHAYVIGAMLALMALGLVAAIILPGMDRWNKRFFIVQFSVLLLLTIAGSVDVTLYGRPEFISIERVVWYFEGFFIVMFFPLFSIFLVHSSGEAIRRSAFLHAVFGLWAVYLILMTFGPSAWYYTVTQDSFFEPGPWYLVVCSPMLVIMALNLVALVRRRRKLSKRYFVASLIHLVPLLISSVIYVLFFNALIFEIGVSISALVMYGVILSDHIDRFMSQQEEIIRQRAKIMVLQMRPHFIYNTMVSIYCLCNQDPRKARQVTLDFTTYLRKIFTAVASEETIPFSEELEHTRAYLAVEQAQFEESLFVDYDTPHTRFRLPPLTLQPIVENAVKHGMDPGAGPLRISIRTRETPSGSEIVVEDNGPGFEPTDDNEPHIALTNIRQRLKLMCGGKLTIMPREGGGTVVKVTLP